jgi:hypothetical protein
MNQQAHAPAAVKAVTRLGQAWILTKAVAGAAGGAATGATRAAAAVAIPIIVQNPMFQAWAVSKYKDISAWFGRWRTGQQLLNKAARNKLFQEGFDAAAKQGENLCDAALTDSKASAAVLAASAKIRELFSKALQIDIKPLFTWAYKLGTSPLNLTVAITAGMVYAARKSGVPISPVIKVLLKKGPGSGVREHIRYIGRVMAYYTGADEEMKEIVHEFVFKKFLGRVGFKSPSPTPRKPPTTTELVQSLHIRPRTPTPRARTPTPYFTPRIRSIGTTPRVLFSPLRKLTPARNRRVVIIQPRRTLRDIVQTALRRVRRR